MSSCVHMMSAGAWHQFLLKNTFLCTENAIFAALRAAVSSHGSAQKVKKVLIFCTNSTFFTFLGQSSSKLPRNWHHPFCLKRGGVKSLYYKCQPPAQRRQAQTSADSSAQTVHPNLDPRCPHICYPVARQPRAN